MYIESIKYQSKKDSEWKSGWLIAETEDSLKYIFLDKEYNPLPKRIWDFHHDSNRDIYISVGKDVKVNVKVK